MYDLLHFIDSPDIREYNRDTCFTPAEWAVLVARSLRTTVEEKTDALQYLADHYTAGEFKEEGINYHFCNKGDLQSFRDVVIETAKLWKEALAARFETEGSVFEAYLCEKEHDGGGEYKYFTSYEKAYAYLLRKKQKYLDDEYLKDVKTFARINRIKLDQEKSVDGERYIFDNEMNLVSVDIDGDKAFAEREEFDLADGYSVHVPLPFRKGDIVKVDVPFDEVHYGVFSCDWERPAKTEHINMWVPLEMYIESENNFDYTDGCFGYDDVLRFSFCSDEELPKEEQVLKLIRAVHKGNVNFYTLLHKFGRNELKEMLKWTDI